MGSQSRRFCMSPGSYRRMESYFLSRKRPMIMRSCTRAYFSINMLASSATAGRNAIIANSASPRETALRILREKSRRKTESANRPRMVAVNTVNMPSVQDTAVWSRMGRRMELSASAYILFFIFIETPFFECNLSVMFVLLFQKKAGLPRPYHRKHLSAIILRCPDESWKV